MIELNKLISEAFADLRNDDSYSDSDWWLRVEIEHLRKDGVSFALETQDRETDDFFRDRFFEAVQPDFEFLLNRLFLGSEEEEPVIPGYDLARFWLLKVRGVSYFDLRSNPFDATYDLIERLGLRSAQPDIPFTENLGGGPTPPTRILTSKTLDRAWSLREMNVPQAWDYSKQHGKAPYGRAVRIGHPDTGYTDHIDLDKPYLDIVRGYDFVDDKRDAKDPLDYFGNPGHGLATGSVIMSSGTVTPPPVKGEGGTGGPGKVTGVAPESLLVPIRTVKKVYWVLSSNLARAIYHSSQVDCEVISISLGGRWFRALKAALLDAIQKNLIVIAAAGNNVRQVVWPARYQECIALAATNIKSNPWRHTSRGNAVDVSAPGEQVWRAYRAKSTSPKTQVGPSDGTSYATANAAGVSALWLAHHDRNSLILQSMNVSLQEIFRDQLCQTARKPNGWDTKNYGAGIIDALELLKSPVSSTASKLAGTHQTSSDIEDVENLLLDLYADDGHAILSGIVGQSEQFLERWFEKFGPELMLILTDVMNSGDTELESLHEGENDDPIRFVGVLRRLILDDASDTLRSTLS